MDVQRHFFSSKLTALPSQLIQAFVRGETSIGGSLGTCKPRKIAMSLCIHSPPATAQQTWRHALWPSLASFVCNKNHTMPILGNCARYARKTESERSSPSYFLLIRCTCQALFLIAARTPSHPQQVLPIKSLKLSLRISLLDVRAAVNPSIHVLIV